MTVQVRSNTRSRRRSAKDKVGDYIHQYGSGVHKGKWFVKVPNGRTPTGQLTYKRYGPFPNTAEGLAEAKTKRDARLAEQAAGVTSVALGRAEKAMTLNTWAVTWKTVKIANRNSAATIEQYVETVDKHVLPYLGGYPLTGDGRLTKTIIEAWREKLKEEGVGLFAINCAIKRLKTCLADAVTAGDTTGLEVNPAKGVEFVDTGDKEKRESNYSDYPKLYAAAGDHYLAKVINVGVDTGLRISELCALRWRDADLERVDPRTGRPAPRLVLRYHLVVRGTAKDGDLEQAFRPGTKASKGKTEYVPLSQTAVAALRAHRAILGRQKMSSKAWNRLAGSPSGWFYAPTKNATSGPAYIVPSDPVADDALIFPSSDGTPQRPGNLSHWFERLAAKAAVEMTIHDMRHDCGSFMLTANPPAPLPVVSKHLRHASVDFTAREYINIVGEQIHAGADAMDALWASLEARAEAV